MVRILGSVFLFTFMVLLNACEDSTPSLSPSAAISSSKPSVQATPAVTSNQASIRSKLQNLRFGQRNKEQGYMFIDWKAAEVPSEPFQIVHHLEDVNVNATFTGLSLEERQILIDHIRIEGNVDWEIKPNPSNSNVLLIQFYKPSTAFVLHLGDLPSITFTRKEPISYTFISNPEKDTPHLLLWAREYATRLLVPEEESSVVLAFSEEMRGDLPTTNEGKPIEANWLDNRHLSIGLNNMSAGEYGNKELLLRFDTLTSQSGNRLEGSNASLMIRQLPKYDWRDVKSGDRVGLSPRDRFYEQMILSKDKQSYVGIVRLGGSMGDGDGTSYSFVLERKGHDPVVIEDVFYSTIEPDDMPIQWMDAKTLIYSSYFAVYAYDIEKGEKRILHDNGANEQNNINYAVYDSTRKLLHILAYVNRNETSQLDLLTYDQGERLPKRTKNYTDTVLVGKYSNLDMNIIPTLGGTYWTRIQGGIPFTDFVNNSEDRVTTEGIVRLVLDQGAYLERYKKGDYQLESTSWVFWQPDKTAKPIAKLPEYSHIFACGLDLISLQESGYYKYDPALDKWVVWKAINGEKNAEPVKGSDGLYRVRK